jgi:GTPase SAR1 family protein
MSNKVFENCNGCILVFDLTEPKSFETVKKQMKIITEKKLIPDKNFVIVGNKLDLCTKDSNARKISQ